MIEFIEKEPNDVADLKELQEQARFNTKNINRLRYDLERETDETEKHKKELELNGRKTRSGLLLRRRRSLEDVEKKEKQKQQLEEKHEASRVLKFNELESMKDRVMSQLMDLAAMTESAQMKASTPEARELAVHIRALGRGCHAAIESLKRVPSLKRKQQMFEFEYD